MSGRHSPYAPSRSSGGVRGHAAPREQPVSRAVIPLRTLGDAAGSRSSSVPQGPDRKWLEGLPESQLEHLYHALRATGTAGGDAAPIVREKSPPPFTSREDKGPRGDHGPSDEMQHASGAGAQWSITPFAGEALTPPRSSASMRASDLMGIASPPLRPSMYPPKEGTRAVGSSARPSHGPGRLPSENGAVHHAPRTAAVEQSERLIDERRHAVTDLLERAGAAQQRVAAHLRSLPPTIESMLYALAFHLVVPSQLGPHNQPF